MSDKQDQKPQSLEQLKITNVPMELKADLQNIADNLGVELSGLCKIELRKAVNAYPPQMRTRRKID